MVADPDPSLLHVSFRFLLHDRVFGFLYHRFFSWISSSPSEVEPIYQPAKQSFESGFDLSPFLHGHICLVYRFGVMLCIFPLSLVSFVVQILTERGALYDSWVREVGGTMFCDYLCLMFTGFFLLNDWRRGKV